MSSRNIASVDVGITRQTGFSRANKDSTKGYWSGLGIVVIGVGTWAPTFLYFNVVAKDRCDAAEWSSVW